MLSCIKLHARLTSTLQILEDGVPAIASELSMRPRTGMAFGLSPQKIESPTSEISCNVDAQPSVQACQAFCFDNVLQGAEDA